MRDEIDQLEDKYNELCAELKDAAKRPHIKTFLVKLRKALELSAITQSYQHLKQENAEEIAARVRNTKDVRNWLWDFLPPPEQTQEDES